MHAARRPHPSRLFPAIVAIMPIMPIMAALAAWLLLVCQPAWAGPGKGFLWTVEGKRPVYLLGSIHLAEPGLYPLDEAVERAFAASDVLVVEADVTGPAEARAARLFVERGTLPAGEDLASSLSPATLERLKARSVDLGLYGSMRPWALALVLQSVELDRLGYDPALGVDRHFLLRARERGLAVEELEGLEAQYALFADMDPVMEEDFLAQTLDELDASAALAREIVSAWRRGDTRALERAIFAGLEEDPRAAPVHERIFFARNRAMATKIKAYLEKGRAAFVVLGAGHLVGERGVVALLREMGYTVRGTEDRRRAGGQEPVRPPAGMPAQDAAYGANP